MKLYIYGFIWRVREKQRHLQMKTGAIPVRVISAIPVRVIWLKVPGLKHRHTYLLKVPPKWPSIFSTKWSSNWSYFILLFVWRDWESNSRNPVPHAARYELWEFDDCTASWCTTFIWEERICWKIMIVGQPIEWQLGVNASLILIVEYCFSYGPVPSCDQNCLIWRQSWIWSDGLTSIRHVEWSTSPHILNLSSNLHWIDVFIISWCHFRRGALIQNI